MGEKLLDAKRHADGRGHLPAGILTLPRAAASRRLPAGILTLPRAAASRRRWNDSTCRKRATRGGESGESGGRRHHHHRRKRVRAKGMPVLREVWDRVDVGQAPLIVVCTVLDGKLLTCLTVIRIIW